MRGSWGVTVEDCTDVESEGRISVTARTVEFPGIRLDLTRIETRPDGGLRLTARRSESDSRGKMRSKGTTRFDMRLLTAERLLLQIAGNPSEEFSPCKPTRLIG